MTHTEFWLRLEETLGRSYARSWAQMHVLAALGSRTPVEALDAGVSPKEVWAAVWRDLELPERER